MCIPFMCEMEGVRSDVIVLDIKIKGLTREMPARLAGVWERAYNGDRLHRK